MGCASTKSGAVSSQGKPESGEDDNEKYAENQYGESEEDDEFVAVEEAVAYVQQELAIDHERALQMVISVCKDDDTRVSCIAIVLLNERIKEIKENLAPKFEAHDPDGTGHVTPEIAMNILLSEFKGISAENARSMVERFDTDGNNQVDFCEFIEFYAFIKSKRTEMEGLFDELDADKSGDLDTCELIQVLIKECSLKEAQARALVDDFDTDNNGTLDRTEFMSMWMNLFG